MSFFFAPLVTTFLIKVYSSSSLNLSSAMFFWKEYVRNHYDGIYLFCNIWRNHPNLNSKDDIKMRKKDVQHLLRNFRLIKLGISDGFNIFAQPSNIFGNCKRNWPCWYLGQHTNINLENFSMKRHLHLYHLSLFPLSIKSTTICILKYTGTPNILLQCVFENFKNASNHLKTEQV